MATQVQFRRGTTSQTSSFTGAVGEVTVDSDKDTVVVHDGSQAGGFAVANLKTAQEFTATQNFNATTLSDGATVNWDVSANQVTSVTIAHCRVGRAWLVLLVHLRSGCRKVNALVVVSALSFTQRSDRMAHRWMYGIKWVRADAQTTTRSDSMASSPYERVSIPGTSK